MEEKESRGQGEGRKYRKKCMTVCEKVREDQLARPAASDARGNTERTSM